MCKAFPPARFFNVMTSVTDDNGANRSRSISYLVVGINTIEESKKIFKFLRLNGYKDVSLFHDFPEIKGTEMSITTQEPRTERHPFSRILGLPNTFGRISYRTSNDELLTDQESSSRTSTEEQRGTGFCCVLCGKIRPLLDARNAPKKLEQNVIFLSCLLMENAIDMYTATKLYKETLVTFRRLCQKHFIRAAAFIGREIKKMSGLFPVYGLHNVSKNVLEVFLAHLQVFADCLDEKVILGTYDVIRFFNDCLARYHSADDWGVAEMQEFTRRTRKRKELSPLADVPEKVRPPSQTGAVVKPISTTDYAQSPLYNEAKEEPVDFEEISATDLLLSHSAPSSSSSMSFDSPSSANKAVTLTANGEECEKQPIKDGTEPGSSTSETVRNNFENSSTFTSDCSTSLDSYDDEKFRQRFRMSRYTFEVLCNALEPWLGPRWKHTTKSSTAIRVGTALEIMAGKISPKEELDPTGAEIFSNVLDALLDWSGKAIQWPSEGERERISKSFFEMSGVDGIVGCVDGTVVDLLNPTDASNSNCQALNVSVITDDQMMIRWVFAKYRSDVDDNTVFKRSLLCEQLRDGTKKGILVGDDAYVDEPFLLTPSSQFDPVRADKLRDVHRIAQETIVNWKRQFPILSSNMRSSKVARIIVGCAALYNLTRLEGEPVFGEDEDEEVQIIG